MRIRLIAALEALKGVLALGLGFGVVATPGDPLTEAAQELVIGLHLDPRGRAPLRRPGQRVADDESFVCPPIGALSYRTSDHTSAESSFDRRTGWSEQESDDAACLLERLEFRLGLVSVAGLRLPAVLEPRQLGLYLSSSP